MSEEVSAPAGVAAPAALKSPKKASTKVSKGKAKAVPTHPKVSAMVTASISALKERGGSSLQAIKKYMSANYKVDVEKLSPFIRKYLKSAVAAGALVQTKGKGATGSFKLSAKSDKPSPAARKPKKEAGAAKKRPASATAGAARKKKPGTAKKSPAKRAKSAKPKKPKAEKKAAAPKSPKKPKAAKKTPAKKPAAKKASSKK
ncbi:histone H1-III-like [Ixodes scapularis]|uniref:histone H1-III-like n=1 Tax=Ixodes scapularis TaxID=6945 RepID=UPI001161B70B|nr:histone H1-III-like [Ixodes scapularis]XP_040075443.2 histone H1-III-like [Ixodes scapularis]XP_042147054.1 histone H1-III-like [Ixodes scapularis]XP_042147071.1 histone H1-III-like [Ixodes scapularis]